MTDGHNSIGEPPPPGFMIWGIVLVIALFIGACILILKLVEWAVA